MGCRKARVHHSGGVPRIFIVMENKLSIFIDESGDFGKYDVNAPFYLFSMIFHDQNNNLSDKIYQLDYKLSSLSTRSLIHCGPLIRKEEIYRYDTLEERRSIFNSLYYFALRAPVSVHTISVNKKECDPEDDFSLSSKLVKQLADFIRENLNYFYAFDQVCVYYDGGQKELAQIIHNTFQTLLSNVIFKKIRPDDYKLQQVADLFCTLTLLQLKEEQNDLSSSELLFFKGRRALKKDYLKILDKKSFLGNH